MSELPEITTGDAVSLAVTLKKNGETFTIDSGAEVKAALVSTNHSETYSLVATQSSSSSGADWDNSLVIVEFAPTDTSGITYQGLAYLEIQVSENGAPKTWFVMVRIVAGRI